MIDVFLCRVDGYGWEPDSGFGFWTGICPSKRQIPRISRPPKRPSRCCWGKKTVDRGNLRSAWICFKRKRLGLPVFESKISNPMMMQFQGTSPRWIRGLSGLSSTQEAWENPSQTTSRSMPQQWSEKGIQLLLETSCVSLLCRYIPFAAEKWAPELLITCCFSVFKKFHLSQSLLRRDWGSQLKPSFPKGRVLRRLWTFIASMENPHQAGLGGGKILPLFCKVKNGFVHLPRIFGVNQANIPKIWTKPPKGWTFNDSLEWINATNAQLCFENQGSDDNCRGHRMPGLQFGSSVCLDRPKFPAVRFLEVMTCPHKFVTWDVLKTE